MHNSSQNIPKDFLPHEYRNMDSLIPSEQQERIIETIFFNDTEKYLRTIKIFNCLESWEDGSDLLELIFHSNKLDPLSREAHKFTSIVRNCFEE
jgi:hypothetical protein